MVNVGMDVRFDNTVFDLFDPDAEAGRRHRTVRRPTTVEGIESALPPLNGTCRVAFEVGTQVQWVAKIVRPPVPPTSPRDRNPPAPEVAGRCVLPLTRNGRSLEEPRL